MRRGRKSRAKKIATPLEFQEKMEKWRDLLKFEIKAETEKIRDIFERFFIEVLLLFFFFFSRNKLLFLLNVLFFRQYLSQCSWNDLVERGLAIGNLSLISESFHPVLGHIADLKPSKISLSSRMFRPGVPFVLCKGANVEHIGECIFLRATYDNVRIKLQNDLHLPRGVSSFSLIPSTNAGALQKIEDFLYSFNRSKLPPGFDLLRIAYRSLALPVAYNDRNLRSYPLTFNESQKRAVDAALNLERPFVVIHGPPGTGKTAVVSEIILQAVKQKQKVLVCAPSHLAVDNVLHRVENKVKACRIGLDSEGSLDSFVQVDDHYDDLVKVTAEMNLARENMNKSNQWMFHKLRQKARSVRKGIEKNIVETKDVIFSTLMSGSLRRLCTYGYQPDLIIVDEAAQAFECMCWLAVLSAKRCILAGDHHQLSAVIHTPEAMEGGLGVSLMESLCNRFGPLVSHLLTVQYRMNEKIMRFYSPLRLICLSNLEEVFRWSSDQFYGGQLEADASVANISLSEISDISKTSLFNEPLLMFDTYSPLERLSKEQFHKLSYRNVEEANIVYDYVKFIERSGVRIRDIGVITPYYAQVAHLRKKFGLDIVKTVDGFQGQQKEVIIMSLVRDNTSGGLGFLQDERRLNVAVTRAKRQFILVGNSRMMRQSSHLSTLLFYFEKFGKIVALKGSASEVLSYRSSTQ